MNKTRSEIFRTATGIAILLLAAGNIFLYVTRPKIAYVRSLDLIEKYQGTVEARSEFDKKKNGMSSNVDSLKMDFERARTRYISSMNNFSVQQRKEYERVLTQQQEQLIRYSEAVESKVEEEDKKMMQEVLNQINSFIEEYAKREKYSLILGTTLSGNLLYGEDGIDITDQLIVELNNRYQGK